MGGFRISGTIQPNIKYYTILDCLDHPYIRKMGQTKMLSSLTPFRNSQSPPSTCFQTCPHNSVKYQPNEVGSSPNIQYNFIMVCQDDLGHQG